MAKLNGILKIEGTLQDMTFYKSQDGHLVRTKGGVSGDRIANDPAFVRTKENGAEIGASASAGKFLRDAFRNMVETSADNRVTSRLTQVMTQLKNLDTISVRGERSVDKGIATSEGKALLKDFNFNINAILRSILYKPYSVITATGVTTNTNLIPATDISEPSGATHVRIKGAFGVVDFDLGTSEVFYTNVVTLPVNNTSTTISLTPTAVPTAAGTKIYLLLIEFFQEVNGTLYSLNNGAYNALAIIDVV